VAKCLNGHRMAAQVGYDFNMKLRNGEQGLEAYLASLKKNNKLIMKNQYWATIPYLAELFYEISNGYISNGRGIPSNYKALIDGVAQSNYEQILWLT